MGHSLKARKRDHFNGVKRMHVKNFAFCQRVVDIDHFVAWYEARILKMEANYSKRHTA